MKLTLIRGIPGSGKTTRAEELMDGDTEHFEADMFFEEFNRETGELEYCFDKKFIGDAHIWCQGNAAAALFNGSDVIVSNTSIYISDIYTYYDIAERYGAEFEIINCTGDYKNTHNVPKKVLERMKSYFKVITTEEFMEKGSDI